MEWKSIKGAQCGTAYGTKEKDRVASRPRKKEKGNLPTQSSGAKKGGQEVQTYSDHDQVCTDIGDHEKAYAGGPRENRFGVCLDEHRVGR